MHKAYLVLLLWVWAGCTKENLDDCEQLPGIRAVTYAPSGSEPVHSQDVGTVMFYVFDEDERFLETFSAALNETVLLDYPRAARLHVVGLANTENGNPKTEGVITLRYLRDYLSMPVYDAPADVFWGEVQCINDRKAGSVTNLPITRVVSSVNIKIRGLKEYRQVEDEDFKLVLSADYRGVNFYGQPQGGPANYMPIGTFVSQDPSQYNVPNFRIISQAQGSPVVLKIYHKNELIDSFSADSNGQPFMAYNGKLLEIQISYTAYLSVSIQIHSEWDKESYWKEF